MSQPFRMDAYYFGFTPTGVESIDLILSAVACAGKAYHHTDQWLDPTEPWHDKLRGGYPAEWIQRAAEDAAKQLDEARAAITAARNLLRQRIVDDVTLQEFRAWESEHAPTIRRASNE